MKKKSKETVKIEKIKCWDFFGIELFVNPAWKPMLKNLKIDESYKVLHGEFFFRDYLENCQIIVSEEFLTKFLSEYELVINRIHDQYIWTIYTKEVKEKLLRNEFEVKFLFLYSDKEDLKPEDLNNDDDVDIFYVFKLIEKKTSRKK